MGKNYCRICAVIQALIAREKSADKDVKRFNERVKYAASALNSTSIVMLGSSVILPSIKGDSIGVWSFIWFSIGLALHIIGHLVLSLLKSETGNKGKDNG